jgi:hypothetical protein
MTQEAYYLVVQSYRAVHKLIIIVIQLLRYDICDSLTRFVKCFWLTAFWSPAMENNSVRQNITISCAVHCTSCPQGGWIIECVMDNARPAHPSSHHRPVLSNSWKAEGTYRGCYKPLYPSMFHNAGSIDWSHNVCCSQMCNGLIVS